MLALANLSENFEQNLKRANSSRKIEHLKAYTITISLPKKTKKEKPVSLV